MAAKGNDVARILQGNMENLPKQESSKVRIFFSSTFTDYQEERNYLMREVIPQLRLHCQKHGVEFQVADMRWGVRDEAQDDHLTTKLCRQQVRNCRTVSKGPYLVIFLGEKYGYRPYPSEIEASEYRCLFEEVDRFNTSLLEEWFILDENTVPATYILQPITSKFPHYSDESEENAELHEKDVESWDAVNTLLTNIFREAAVKAYNSGTIDMKTKHKYLRSVTEAEIDEGLLSVESSEYQNRVFCFMRSFSDFNIEDSTAKRFSDLEGLELDTEAHDLLQYLKVKAVPEKLSQDDIYSSTVSWTPKGIDPSVESHSIYLKEIGKVFYEKVIQQLELRATEKKKLGMVEKLYQEVIHHATFCKNKVATFTGRENLLLEVRSKMVVCKSDPGAAEAVQKMMKKKEEFKEKVKGEKEQQLQMLKMAASKQKNVDSEKEDAHKNYKNQQKGIANEMDNLGRHLESMGIKFATEQAEPNPQEMLMQQLEMMPLEKYTLPLILHGESGCGKTALLAKIASEVDSWFDKPIVKIVRFLGTSPRSNSLKTLLLYICKQIWFNYKVESHDNLNIEKDTAVLVLYFKALLQHIDTREKPLVIILDSIDQLDGSDNPYSMTWLPKKVPWNIYIIASMLPSIPKISLQDSKPEESTKMVHCLKNAQNSLGMEGHFVEVPALPEETAEDILRHWMEGSTHTLTADQVRTVLEHFKSEPKPLFLQLAYGQATCWRSYTPASQWTLGHSVQAAIDQLFTDLENQHGKVLVSKALGYLTASKNGLSDTELEDVLSLDDEVLQDTYLYHLPPDPSNVRLPPLLWQRIRGQLGEYLVEKESDQVTVISWYHRQFVQVAQMKYVFTEGTAQTLHDVLAEYFLGTWCDQPKPLQLYKRKKGSYPNAYRQVPSQPNSFSAQQYNHRKLSELPFHMTLTSRTGDLLKITCHDLDWLHSKARAKGIQEVLNDLKFAKDALINQGKSAMDEAMVELQTLYDLLILRSDILWKDPNNLPVQLLAQLGMNKNQQTAGLASLLDQCQAWCETIDLPLLVPTTRCLPYPSPSVKLTLSICIANLGDPSENEIKCAVSEDGKTLYAVDKQKQGLGDLLRVYDLEQGYMTQVVPMKDMDVKTIHSIANKYLYVSLYVRRDKYEPQLRFKLLNESLVVPSGIKEDDQVRAVSCQVTYAFVLEPLPGQADGSGDGLGFGSRKDKDNFKPVIVNLNTGERISFPDETETMLTDTHIRHALFSQDDRYLVVLVKHCGVIIDMKTRKITKNLLDEDKNSFSFSRGDGDQHKLLETTRILSNNKILLASTMYEKYISLCDLESGKKLHNLWRQKGDKYDCDKMAVNRAETLVAMATASSSIVNGNTQKDCVVWNLETGRVHAVIPNRDGWFACIDFCGKNDEYVICCHDYSKSIADVWYIGTEESPLPFPEAVKVYEFSTLTQVVRFCKTALDGQMLVTASLDNIVTIHSMAYIESLCQQALPKKLEEMVTKMELKNGEVSDRESELEFLTNEEDQNEAVQDETSQPDNLQNDNADNQVDTNENDIGNTNQEHTDENDTGDTYQEHADENDTGDTNQADENDTGDTNQENTNENDTVDTNQEHADTNHDNQTSTKNGPDPKDQKHTNQEGSHSKGADETLNETATQNESNGLNQDVNEDDLHNNTQEIHQEDTRQGDTIQEDTPDTDVVEKDTSEDNPDGPDQDAIQEDTSNDNQENDKDNDKIVDAENGEVVAGDYEDDADDRERGHVGLDESEDPETSEVPPVPGEASITTTCLTLTRDGSKAVVGTKDGWVLIIDLETGKVIKHYKQGDKTVSKALATSTGKYLVTAEQKAVVWTTDTWEKHMKIKTTASMYGGSSSPSDLAEAQDILVVAIGGMECYGFVWNLNTKQMIKQLQGLYGFGKVVITSDAKQVVTTFFDFPMVFSVDGDSAEEGFDMNQMDTMMAGCSCLCISPSDRLVLSGSTDGSVRIMDIATNKFIFRMQHLSSVKQAAFSPDGRHVITGGFRSILIWSTLDGSLVSSLANHQEFINCFIFSQDSKFLISGSNDKRIIIWDFENKSSVATFTAHCPVEHMVATPDLQTIIYCPENIDYIAIMQPNAALKNILTGGKLEVPEILQKAQALALSFSPESVKKTTSKSCVIL